MKEDSQLWSMMKYLRFVEFRQVDAKIFAWI
jgi:hypothetical protein